MKKKVTYTSTLPEDVLESVNDYSEKNSISKNKVVETALRHFFFSLKKSDFREGFKRAAGDLEMKTMADAGIEDYCDLVNQNEKEVKWSSVTYIWPALILQWVRNNREQDRC